jgi:hypothetical protein
MKYPLIILLMAVVALAAASQAAAGLRISGLECIRSMPDRKHDAARVIPGQAARPAGAQASRECVPRGTEASTGGMQSGGGGEQQKTRPGAGRIWAWFRGH